MRFKAFLFASFLSVSCFAEVDFDNEPIIEPTKPLASIESIDYIGDPITNNWMYSALRYIEVLNENKEKYSVEYLLYCHLKYQLRDRKRKTLDVKGSFGRARNLINECGLIPDKFFLSDLDSKQKRQRQAEAIAYLNMSLSDGKLKIDRDEWTILSELNDAFKIKFGAIANNVVFTSDIKIKKTNLKTMLHRSIEIMPSDRFISAAKSQKTDNDIKLQRLVIRALNAGYPVILNWTVETAALDEGGNFDAKLIKSSDEQFWQSSLVIDYEAEGPDNFGYAFFKKENTTDKTIKHLASVRGFLTSLLIENHWYGSQTPKKESHIEKNGIAAHRLKSNYLFDYFIEIQDGKPTGKQIKGIKSFILPKE
jgi:hypothetical protein